MKNQEMKNFPYRSKKMRNNNKFKNREWIKKIFHKI